MYFFGSSVIPGVEDELPEKKFKHRPMESKKNQANQMMFSEQNGMEEYQIIVKVWNS